MQEYSRMRVKGTLAVSPVAVVTIGTPVYQTLRGLTLSLDEADAFLAAGVIRGERLFARDEEVADEYDLYVLRRAGDLAPLERDRMARVLGETE
jgi:hypothetical protein